MKTCRFYLLNDYLTFFRYAWYRVICPFYTMTLHFFEVSTGDIESRHDKLNFGTTFILSNDGCIFDL